MLQTILSSYKTYLKNFDPKTVRGSVGLMLRGRTLGATFVVE